jgi:hypothetical protein
MQGRRTAVRVSVPVFMACITQGVIHLKRLFFCAFQDGTLIEQRRIHG